MPSVNERSALLPNSSNPQSGGDASAGKKFTPLHSTRHLLLGSWINVLLIFVPLSILGASR